MAMGFGKPHGEQGKGDMLILGLKSCRVASATRPPVGESIMPDAQRQLPPSSLLFSCNLLVVADDERPVHGTHQAALAAEKLVETSAALLRPEELETVEALQAIAFSTTSTICLAFAT